MQHVTKWITQPRRESPGPLPSGERRTAERARDGAAVDPHDADLRPPLDVQFRRNG